MARCYLTGVEMSLEDAYVLHRRAVHHHLAALKDRTASLQRLVAQLSPLDVEEPFMPGKASSADRPTQRRHRLVCKAVAEALGPAYPDIQVFLNWPAYRATVRATRTQQAPLNSHSGAGEKP